MDDRSCAHCRRREWASPQWLLSPASKDGPPTHFRPPCFCLCGEQGPRIRAAVRGWRRFKLGGIAVASMKLFHASVNSWKSGEVITASRQTTYFPAVTAVLEAHRPAGLPSRSICLFNTDTIVGATKIMESEKAWKPGSIGDFKVYEIEADGFHRAPLRLNHEINMRLKDGQLVNALVAEYWNPTADWFFYEFFGPSFLVVQEVPPAATAHMYPFGLRYDRDIRISASL